MRNGVHGAEAEDRDKKGGVEGARPGTEEAIIGSDDSRQHEQEKGPRPHMAVFVTQIGLQQIIYGHRDEQDGDEAGKKLRVDAGQHERAGSRPDKGRNGRSSETPEIDPAATGEGRHGCRDAERGLQLVGPDGRRWRDSGCQQGGQGEQSAATRYGVHEPSQECDGHEERYDVEWQFHRGPLGRDVGVRNVRNWTRR